MQRAKTPSSSEDGLEVMEEKQVAGGQSQRWCWAVSFADSSGRKAGEGNGKPVFLPGESHGPRSLVGYKSMELQRVRHD